MYNTDLNNYAPSGASLLSFEQINKLKSYSFWIKFITILSFISLVPTIILGAALAIIIIGIPILLVGIFMIYVNLKLWRASKALDSIVDNNNQQSFNTNGLEFIVNVGNYYKLTGILMIVSWGSSLILTIFLIMFGSVVDSYLKDFDQNIQNSIISEAQK